ncbi:divalent-cation tolerance protein CutA [Actinophytocola sediminis]
MPSYLQVTTVADAQETAVRIARSAVEKRFAASAQVRGPVISVFWHLGRLEEGKEWVVILKTAASRYAELREHLLDIHPWDNPEVTATEMIGGTDAYNSWLDRTVGTKE